MRLTLCICASISLLSCKKEELDKLPEITQTGKDTMGCLVDGQAWLPKQGSARTMSGTPIGPIYAEYRSAGGQGGTLDISFDRGGASRIGFWALDVRGTGVVRFDQDGITPTSSARSYAFFAREKTYPTVYYATNATAQGQLTITRLDPQARIVSGTFEFTGQQPDGTTVRVTEGRFDIHLTH